MIRRHISINATAKWRSGMMFRWHQRCCSRLPSHVSLPAAIFSNSFQVCASLSILTLTDSIDDNLQGNVGNLFFPLGWVAMGLFIASVLLLYSFISWGKRQARHLANATAPKPTEEAVGLRLDQRSNWCRSAEIEDTHADELVQSKNDNSATYSTNHQSGFQRAPSLSSKFWDYTYRMLIIHNYFSTFTC